MMLVWSKQHRKVVHILLILINMTYTHLVVASGMFATAFDIHKLLSLTFVDDNNKIYFD